MRRFLLSSLLASTMCIGAASAGTLREEALTVFSSLPDSAPKIATNNATPEKIALGTALFFDPRLSASGVFSCYSCHNLTTGGDDNMETSVGHGWQKGPRNSPTVFNSALNAAQF